ncbi:MAG TPA: HAD-IIB family hydrolase [Pseudomonadales bacterium]|nr:HAD-IIB family hydrolase [Pseudomonadales bacterium]
MRFKALAIDLDGTMLVGEKIPPDNVVAVRAARDAGLSVIIATARWHQMALRVGAELGIADPVIACSGAQVHLPAESRDIFDERLPADFVAALYDLCDAERCVATVTVGDGVLLKLDGEPDRAAMMPEMRWVPRLTGAAPTLPRVAAIQGTKANARIRAELEPKFSDRVHFFDSIGPSGKVILTITAATASKGAALQAACRHLELQPRDVVAFGDAENDIEMFRVAGASVAMGQADDAVKAHATAVTARNDEAGVARAIERLLATGQVA